LNEEKLLTDSDFKIEYDLDTVNKTSREMILENLLYDLFFKNNNTLTEIENLTSDFLRKLINILDDLSEQSLDYLTKMNENSSKMQVQIMQNLIRIRNVHTFNTLILNLIKSPEPNIYKIEFMNKLIRLANSGRTKLKGDVRFDLENSLSKSILNNEDKELRAQILNRFRRAVRFVIMNREWFKTSNKDKKEEYEMFFRLNNEDMVEFDALNNKKIQLLFNKNDFKAQKSILANTFITDFHRQILTKDQNTRSEDQCEFLLGLINTLPRLNSFPNYVLKHIGQLLKLIVFEKGREIVREGHRAVGFYYILNGGCDVLSIGLDGLLKIDELQPGDNFGEKAFNQSDSIHSYTVITNQLTEILMIEPDEIEAYLENMRIYEKEKCYEFISNWWPTKYWNWTENEFRKFSDLTKFMRYQSSDIVHQNSSKISANFRCENYIYFVIKGKLDVVYQCKYKDKDLKLRVCVLEKENYFGYFEKHFLIKSSDESVDEDAESHLIRISKGDFLSIHKHASFLLSHMIEDYKLVVPDCRHVLEFYRKKKIDAIKK
jgi:hypothetical protein